MPKFLSLQTCINQLAVLKGLGERRSIYAEMFHGVGLADAFNILVDLLCQFVCTPIKITLLIDNHNGWGFTGGIFAK